MAGPGPRPRPREADVGLTAYATSTPPLGGRLKVRIEDFTVDEVGPRPIEDAGGRYAAARVRLTNWETNAFVREASRRLGLSRKKVHFSGTKDKRGVTEQWFTFEAEPAAVASLAGLSGVQVLEVVRAADEVELGDHAGNRFRLVLRGVEADPARARALVDAAWAELQALGGAPNVFGPQRFGARRATTHRVGERMVRGDFDGAVRTYLDDPSALQDDAARSAWREALAASDWHGCLGLLAGDVPFERALLHRLAETGGDALAALEALPRNLQRLFVYAHQSALFNRVLTRRLERGLPLGRPVVGDLAAPVEDGRVEEEWVPVTASNLDRVAQEAARGRAVVTGLLPGTEAPFANGPMGEVERGVLAEAATAPRDFLIPERLEWSSKGTRRALVAAVEGFAADVGADEVLPGRTCVTFAFALPPGSYATGVLREFMKSPWLDDYA